MQTNPAKDLDRRVRIAAFAWLSEQVNIHGDVLPRTTLAQGFIFEDQRILLVSPQGIFKPKILPEYPLSITTTTSGHYDDGFTPEGLLLYKYRGTDPYHPENVGLRSAMFQIKGNRFIFTLICQSLQLGQLTGSSKVVDEIEKKIARRVEFCGQFWTHYTMGKHPAGSLFSRSDTSRCHRVKSRVCLMGYHEEILDSVQIKPSGSAEVFR